MSVVRRSELVQRDEKGPAKADDDDAIIEEVVSRLDMCMIAEADDNAEAIDDLEHLHGRGQWPEHIRRMREHERRPCLTINTLPTYAAQVSNDMRQNKIAIKVHPVDNQADPETAEVFQGIIRHIEYASSAAVAYYTAGASAVHIGRGYFRLCNEYESENSFNQTIRIKRIRNALSVHPDPFRMQPDGSDARFWILGDDMPRDEFRRQYPKAKAASLMTTHGMSAAFSGWLEQDVVRVVEYYRYSEHAEKLLLLDDGTTCWEDEIGDRTAVDERQSKRRIVEWFKCSAADVLERTKIPCEWIPVFEVLGQELDINGAVTRKGLIRDAKDAARMYNVMMSSATEEIGYRPRPPWVMAEGQDEGYEDMWERSNEPQSRLIYKPTVVDGNLAPPPQRQAVADIPAGYLTMAGHARDDVKATLGLFDSSMGARGTATSGVQERAQQSQGQTTNFHFADNLSLTVAQAGRCLVSMIPRVYDTQRIVRILGDDDTPAFAEVNKPLQSPQRTKSGAIRSVLNDLSAGKYDVTATSGPSYATARQEAAEGMRDMAQAWPRLMDVAGDKMVKAMNWPDGDVIAERLKKTMPTEITEGDGKDQQQDPHVMQLRQQMKQMQQQYEQALGDAMEQLKGKQQEQQTSIETAKAKADADIQIAIIRAQADIEAKTHIAAMNADADARTKADQQAQQTEPDADDAQPDAIAEALAMVAQAVAMQSAPRRKLMRIQAPSGGVYEGEIVETSEVAGSTEGDQE